MTRGGSSPSRLSDIVRRQVGGQDLGQFSKQDYSGYSEKFLFEKKLTPSDVGNLKRLVVPKKYAVKYFPPVGKDVMHLVFNDRVKRQWKFRFAYWNSSKSFVFRKEWGTFVKEKNLKAGDTIAFYERKGRESVKEDRQPFFIIDVKSDLSLRLGQNSVKKEEEKLVEDQVSTRFGASTSNGSFRLFGVHIIP